MGPVQALSSYPVLDRGAGQHLVHAKPLMLRFTMLMLHYLLVMLCRCLMAAYAQHVHSSNSSNHSSSNSHCNQRS